MRKLLALAALFSPLALAQAVIEVDSHAVMRLPSNTSVLLLPLPRQPMSACLRWILITTPLYSLTRRFLAG